MKKLLFICVILFQVVSFAQENDMSRIPENKVKYYQDFISFKGENNKARLDFFIHVPYDAVQFVKTGQGFEAAYTVTVSVFDEEKKNLITEKIWNEKIIAISFELTNSPENFNLGHRSFDLAPGVYSIKSSLFSSLRKDRGLIQASYAWLSILSLSRSRIFFQKPFI